MTIIGRAVALVDVEDHDDFVMTRQLRRSEGLTGEPLRHVGILREAIVEHFHGNLTAEDRVPQDRCPHAAVTDQASPA